MGRNNPKTGDKVKQNGVTWHYRRVNTGDGARTLMWTTKARIGTDGSGRNVFETISAATIEDGVVKLLTARREFSERLAADKAAAKCPTVEQAFTRMLSERARMIEPGTVHTIEAARKHFPGIAGVKLDKLTREQVQKEVDRELREGAAVSSVKLYMQKLNCVRRYFGHSSFVCISFKKPDSNAGKFDSDSDEHFMIPPEQVLEAAKGMGDTDFYNFIVFGLMSMRHGEICGLKFGDIIEREGRHYIRIHAQRNAKNKYISHTKTRQSMREIMLDEDFFKSLEAGDHHPEEHICPKGYSAYSKRIRRLKKLLNVSGDKKFTAHTLRHIFGTYSDEDGSYYFERLKTAGWTAKGGVSETVYRDRNADRCNEFMEKYYKRLFNRREIIITRTA